MEYNLGPVEGPMIFEDTIEIEKIERGGGACAPKPCSTSSEIHGVPSLNKKEDYS